ncbi:putative methyltransferase-domain-containing protein [Myxozyma melibiosi]|uniref:Methyltransferase-domain-containing protein n=1 Tax=Myxozyma melibiosi TaxID=54550 RepID=A0ABR1F793_9ASCO
MYHIRFLKVPYIVPPPSNTQQSSSKTPKANAGEITVSTKITLTTELGENFFYGSVPVRAEIAYRQNANSSVKKRKRAGSSKDKASSILLGETTALWKNGMRALQLDISIPRKVVEELAADNVQIFERVFINATDAADECPLFFESDDVPLPPTFFEIESMPFRFGQNDAGSTPKQKPAVTISYKNDDSLYVKRHVEMGQSGTLTLAEEIGDSMAKHLWDSGIFLCSYLRASKANQEEFISQLITDTDRKQQILEIGCGCGTVGIALSKLVKNSRVLLTDLDSAKEVAERNIVLNQDRSLTPVEFLPFDWDTSQNDEQQNAAVLDTQWDIVVACDCTYNPDSFTSLTDVLKRLIGADTKLLLVHKERHGSENTVFEMLEQKNVLKLQWRQLLEPTAVKSRVDILVHQS